MNFKSTMRLIHLIQVVCRSDKTNGVTLWSPPCDSTPTPHQLHRSPLTVVPSDLWPGPQSYILRLPWFIPVTSHVSKFYLANPIYALPCPVQFSLYLSMCSDLTPLL